MAYRFAPARRPAVAALATPTESQQLAAARAGDPKFILNSEELRDALKWVTAAGRHFPKGSIRVRLISDGRTVRLEAVAGTAAYPGMSPAAFPVLELVLRLVDVIAPGALLFTFEQLQQIPLSREAVTLTVSNKQVVSVVAEGSTVHQYHLHTHNPFDLAAFESCWRWPFQKPPSTPIAVEPGLAAAALKTASTEDSRYALTSALVFADTGRLALVTTDGRRLTILRSPLPPGHAKDRMPKTLVQPYCLAHKKAAVQLCLHPAHPLKGTHDTPTVRAALPDAVLYAPARDGSFPPYEDVIPRASEHVASFDITAEQLRQAAALVGKDKPKPYEILGVRFELSPNASSIIVARHRDKQDTAVTLDLATPLAMKIGQASAFALDSKFVADLADQLKLLGLPSVTVHFIAPTKPLTFTAKTDRVDFTAVIMPLNPGDNR